MARLDPAVDQRWRRRETDHFLTDVEMRPVQNAFAQLRLFACCQLGAEDRAVAPGAMNRLDDQLVEILQDEVAFALLAAPPGRHGGELELFTEKMPGDAGQEGHQAGVLEDAAADRVGDRHVTEPRRLQQAGHAEARILAQFQGIAEGIVDPAQDDVDLVQPLQRFQPDPAVTDTQVVALDQCVAEVIGEVGVLEVARAVGPRSQHHDPRVFAVLRRKPGQAVAQRLEEPGQALDVAVTEECRARCAS